MEALLSSAGWYRGFILKNPNIKVGTVANAVSIRRLGPSIICSRHSPFHANTPKEKSSMLTEGSLCQQGIFPSSYVHLKNAHIKNKG